MVYFLAVSIETSSMWESAYQVLGEIAKKKYENKSKTETIII